MNGVAGGENNRNENASYRSVVYQACAYKGARKEYEADYVAVVRTGEKRYYEVSDFFRNS